LIRLIYSLSSVFSYFYSVNFSKIFLYKNFFVFLYLETTSFIIIDTMLILTGASASGKTVTALDLQKRYGLVKAITTTTRALRDGEQDGVDYFFVTKEEFEKRLKEDKFVEHSIYNSNYYGCGKDQVSDNKVIVLDPNGLHSFQNLHDPRIITVLLVADEQTRRERMLGRGDKHEKIVERLTNDVRDFAKEKVSGCDLVVQTANKNIGQVADEIYAFYISKIQ